MGYGFPPLGERFVRALELVGGSKRLTLGRGYAEEGRVGELRIQGCSASAKVAGRSRPWYRVRLRFQPLTNGERRRLPGVIRDGPPRDIIAALEAARIDLIPKRWSEVEHSCSCPDWSLGIGRWTPCKHVVAVYFRIAEAIERDPRFLLALRGIERPATSTDFPSCGLRFTIREIKARSAEGEADETRDLSLALHYLPPPRWDEDRPRPVPLKEAYARPGGDRALRYAAVLGSYLPELGEAARRKRICLGESRLAAFLWEAGPLLGRLGAEIVMPRTLRGLLRPRAALRVEAKGSRPIAACLGLEALLEYDRGVAIGDRFLSAMEFERLVKEKRAIVAFRDRFVRLDPIEAAGLLEAARSPIPLNALDLVRARLAGEASFSADAEELAASLFRERWVDVPRTLRASLRPYQERGFRWAYSNLMSGFGCVLADDMGLGKTVQAIAVLLRLREDGLAAGGILVVAPAALLTNWERELSRFAPGLKVLRYHGKGRIGALSGTGPSEGFDLALTTFATASRDSGILARREFALLVVDEAHVLKNAATGQARSVRDIKARYRLALSGTPVENKLEDMRALFDLVLPGYLGKASEFRRSFRVPIEGRGDPAVAEKLRRITSPFLMRRLKTDPAIAPDLPEKTTIDEYATLAREQAALYESVVRRGMEEARRADREERLALILKLLTSLKQVCDHPRVYDKESPPKARLSGKAMLLVELLGRMLECREKVLVFSQYVECLELLRHILAQELGEDCLVYSGRLGQEERSRAVDSFQAEGGRRVMLVSLKAGGLGLNLTAASRIVHYDLWFNPAAEEQATDRAFRIGQSKDVFVHRLITAGTFEEKIDRMLKSKRELASMCVATGESWISRLSPDELEELFG